MTNSKLKCFLAHELSIPDNTLSESSDLFDLGLDSMGIMRLITFIEEDYQLTIPEEQVIYDNLHSIENICKLLTSINENNST